MLVFDRIFFKFIAVGLVNTLVGSGLMFLLYNAFGFGYWVSSAASYVVGSVLSFFLNKYFTFSVRRWSVFMVFLFVVTIAVSYGTAYGVSKPVMNYLLQNSSQKIRENVALAAGMCSFTVLNYLGQRFIVFRNKNKP